MKTPCKETSAPARRNATTPELKSTGGSPPSTREPICAAYILTLQLWLNTSRIRAPDRPGPRHVAFDGAVWANLNLRWRSEGLSPSSMSSATIHQALRRGPSNEISTLGPPWPEIQKAVQGLKTRKERVGGQEAAGSQEWQTGVVSPQR